MPKDFDVDAYLKEPSKPAGDFDPDQYAKPPSNRAWQVVRGAGRGVAGLLQSAGEILPDPMSLGPELPKEAQTAREAAKKDLRKFTDKEDESAWETGGRLGGQILPFAFLPGVGATSTLGSIAERAAIGGVAGGLQPTKEHTAASHAIPAAAGAVTGGSGRAILGRGGGLLNMAQAKRTAMHTMVAGAFEQPMESTLEALGLPKKYARPIALAVAGIIIGGSIPPMGPQSLGGSFAARFGGAGAGAAAEKFFGKSDQPRSPQGQ